MKRIQAPWAVALLCAVLLCVGPLSGCGSKNTALTVWCAAMDEEIITQMAKAYMAAHPAIKSIHIEICEDDDVRETLEGNPNADVDVICIPHDQLGALVAQGFLQEITEEAHLGAIRENTLPSIRAGQVDRKQYGFPSSFETHMLFYDKSRVSDETAQTLEGILGGAAFGDSIPFGMDFANAYYTANWFFTYGCMLFGEHGEDNTYCDFDSTAGIAAMTYLIDHRAAFGDLDGDAAMALFKEHKLDAYIGGPWHAAGITEALGGNYGCAKLPRVDGKDMQSFAGFKLYCVNAHTKDKKAAMDLAAWFTNPDNQKTRFQARNLIPVALSLADDMDVAVSTTAKAVMAQGAYAIAMPSIPEMSNFWVPTGEFTLACYLGEVPIGALPGALAELTATILGK